jgi:predicted nuclease of predicted toxin-antitoxin system
MTVLLDANLSPAWIAFLEAAGIHAVHWSSIGLGDAPDTDIVAYAVQAGHIILTQDLDFGTILSAARAIKPSVVQIRVGRVNPLLYGTQVLIALRELAGKPDQGIFITVEKERTRLTLLPFRGRDE